MSRCQFEQLPSEGGDFSRGAAAVQKRGIFAFEDRALQGFATIGVRRASVGIVPRRSTAIADFGLGLVPGPQFHQRVHPEVQMISAEVRPEVAKLLLAGPPDFLDVVEDLFDGRPVFFRQSARREKTDVLAATVALVPMPFHICVSPFNSGRFIFRSFSSA